MSTPNNQESTVEFLARMRAAIDGAAVRPNDLMAVVKALMANFKARFDTLYTLVQTQADKSARRDEGLDSAIKHLSSTVKSLEAALKTKKGRAELESDLNDIWQQIRYLVENMPTAYDDGSLRDEVAALKLQVATLMEEDEEPEIEDEEEELTEEDVIRLITKYAPTPKAGAVGNSMPPADFGPFHESFAMDGNTAEVTLSRGVGAQGTAIMVRYQGQLQDLGNQYTVNGTKVTLAFTPANGTTISVTYWGG